MKYKVIIGVISDDDNAAIGIYEQTVEDLDIKGVIDAVNTPIKNRAPRSDKGKPRKTEEAEA